MSPLQVHVLEQPFADISLLRQGILVNRLYCLSPLYIRCCWVIPTRTSITKARSMQPSRSVLEKKKKKGRKPSFFKFFFLGITDEQLEIPKAFLKHLEGESYGPAFLRCPSGKMSCVNLVEKNDGVFLHKCGWRRFVENHFLQVGYCLVFKYYGKLQFSVRIFDTNACEARVELCCCSSDDCGSKGEEDTERTKGKTSPDYGNLCGHQANGHSAQESSSEVDELDTRNFQEASSHVKFCKHAIHKVENR